MRNFEFPCCFMLMRDIGWLRPRRAQERPGEPRRAQLQKYRYMPLRSKEQSRTSSAHFN